MGNLMASGSRSTVLRYPGPDVRGMYFSIPQRVSVANEDLRYGRIKNKRKINHENTRASSISVDDMITNGLHLSARAQRLVLDAFPSHSDLIVAYCEKVFLNVLKRHPEVKGSLQNILTVDVCDWLRGHSVHCAKVLDLVMTTGLDCLEDVMGSYLLNQGALHAKFFARNNTVNSNNNISCEQSYAFDWDWVAQAMVDTAALSWKIKQDRLETVEAWKLVAFFITRKIEKGFHLELSYNATGRTTIEPSNSRSTMRIKANSLGTQCPVSSKTLKKDSPTLRERVQTT